MTLFILLNIVSFFRLLLIIFVIYYGLKLLMRFVAPKVIENAANKIFQDMKNREAQQSKHSVRKGDVTINYSDKKNNKENHQDGEYVDFEEVDNKK